MAAVSVGGSLQHGSSTLLRFEAQVGAGSKEERLGEVANAIARLKREFIDAVGQAPSTKRADGKAPNDEEDDEEEEEDEESSSEGNIKESSPKRRKT